MKLYHGYGRSWRVCPRLLELDKRHGEHPERWPDCRKGGPCLTAHRHEKPLADPEGHRVDLFVWLPGCRPPEPEEAARCRCGRVLVWSDLDDLYGEEHLTEAEPAHAD